MSEDDEEANPCEEFYIHLTTVGWKWKGWQMEIIAQCAIQIPEMLCGFWLTLSDMILREPCMKVSQRRQRLESEKEKSK